MSAVSAGFPATPAGVIVLSVATWAVVLAPVFLRHRRRSRRASQPAPPPQARPVALPQPVSERGPYDPGAFTVAPAERNPR